MLLFTTKQTWLQFKSLAILLLDGADTQAQAYAAYYLQLRYIHLLLGRKFLRSFVLRITTELHGARSVVEACSRWQ